VEFDRNPVSGPQSRAGIDAPAPSSNDPDTLPLNTVERLAAAIPATCILIAIGAPVIATITDHSETKMGKVGAAPALLFGLLMLHVAALLGFRFKVLWKGNYVIGVATNVVCIGLWTFLIGSCLFRR
jgi:hypothetical protein